jgi:hypothetical protein
MLAVTRYIVLESLNLVGVMTINKMDVTSIAFKGIRVSKNAPGSSTLPWIPLLG